MEQICSCLDWSHETLCKKKRQHTELAEAIKRGQNKGIETVTNALMENAKSGNLGAQVFYLKNRAWWNDAKGGQLVRFDLDPNAKPSENAIKIMHAAANGVISPDVAKIFLDGVSAMMKIEEVTELSERLKALEDKLGG